MSSIHNEEKPVVAERFIIIRTLNTEIYKCMTSMSKDVYIDTLDDIVGEYNKTYHKTIKMKPIDVKDNTYVDSMELHSKKEVKDKDPKFKVGDDVRISKYKNIFAKGYIPNWSEQVFMSSKIKNTVPQTYVIDYLNGKELIETFHEKILEKTYQQEFRTEKVIKEKVINYTLNGKVMIIHLIAGLIRKTQCDSIDYNCTKMSKQFP